MRRKRPIKRFAWSMLVLCWLSTGLMAGDAHADDIDPWEPANRKVFAVNDFFDRILVKPVAKGYQRFVPKPIRRGVSNVFNNIDTPATALNQFLQGKPVRGLSDTGRFLVNSTIGIAGIFDVATPMGLEPHQEDFGQTFGVWGAGPGNHVMVPFRGSSSVRDAIGLVLDAAASPLRLISPNSARYGTAAMYGVDARVDLLAAENLITEGGDRYLFMRDAFLQRRAYLVRDGAVEEDDPFLDDEDF